MKKKSWVDFLVRVLNRWDHPGVRMEDPPEDLHKEE
jgi:hypothetical protein